VTVDEPFDDCRSLAAVSKIYQLGGLARAGQGIADVLRLCQAEGSCPRSKICRERLDLPPAAGEPPDGTTEGKPGTPFRLERFATDIVIDDGSGNSIQRTRIEPPDDDSPLGTLYRYWRALPGRPKLSDVDPMMFRRNPGLDGFVHIVETKSLDPFEWRFRVFGHHLRLPGLPPMEGRRIFDGPPLVYAGAAARDYMTAKCMQMPVAFRVRRAIGGKRRSFDREVLPLFGGGGRVEYLLVAVGNFGEEGPA